MHKVTVLQGDNEIPLDTIVTMVYNRLMNEEVVEDLDEEKFYAVGVKASRMFLGNLQSNVPEIDALLAFKPEVAMHFMGVFVAGMLMKKALDDPDNNLTIQITEIEEEDGNPYDDESSSNSCDSQGSDGRPASGD